MGKPRLHAIVKPPIEARTLNPLRALGDHQHQAFERERDRAARAMHTKPLFIIRP